jgi:hypothetical protein
MFRHRNPRRRGGASRASRRWRPSPDLLETRRVPDAALGYALGVGGTGADIGQADAADKDGNVYVTGSFSGAVNFGGVPLDSAPGSIAAYVAKYNPSGGLVWAKAITTSGSTDEGDAIAVSPTGDVYVAGVYSGNASFGGGVTLPGGAATSMFVAHYDASGNLVWADAVGGGGSASGEGIALDAGNNVYLAGFFTGTVDFDPGPGTAQVTAPGVGADSFLMKLGASGTFGWARTFGNGDGEAGFDVAVDAAGNVYGAGQFRNTVDFGSGFVLNSAGGLDAYVIKLDRLGNTLWADGLGGASDDAGVGIAVDAAGDVVSTGYFHGTADFNPGGGAFNLTSAGGEDAFVSKLGPSGNFLWAKQLGGAADDAASAIALDPAGAVYTTGFFNGPADFDPGPGVHDLSPGGATDAFVSKLDPSGNFLWAEHFGGPLSLTLGSGIAVAPQGVVYAAGEFGPSGSSGGTVNFDPGPATTNLTSQGGFDIYVAKLTQPTTFVAPPAAQGTAIDPTGSGSFTALAANGAPLVADAHDRPLLQFSIAKLDPNATIASVTLVLPVSVAQYAAAQGGVVGTVLGYGGSGTVSPTDATAASQVVGQVVASDPGEVAVAISPQFITSLRGQASYAGFVIELAGGQVLDLVGGAATASAPPPMLYVEYATPYTTPTLSAASDVYTGAENGTLVVPAASGVLANDTDLNHAALTATLVAGPAHGTLSAFAGGGFTYTPPANFSGIDTFAYQVTDGQSQTTALVSIVVTPTGVVTDNDSPGFTTTGSWTTVAGRGGVAGGVNNDYLFAPAGDGSAAASWRTSGLAPGPYDVQVTWTADPNRASNATYRIYDNATLVGTVTVNQQQAPAGPTVGGTPYQSLGQFPIGSGTLRVVLDNHANGFVIADAVRVAPPSPVPAVVDNDDPGYAETGTFTPVLGRGGDNSDYRFAAPSGSGTATATASWTTTGLTAGYYDVQVSWTPDPNRASNATYQIFDGATLVGTATVNQQLAPAGPTANGVTYQSLGVFRTTTGTLRVVLGNNANGFVIADAARVAPTTAPPTVVDNDDPTFSDAGPWTTVAGRGGAAGGVNNDYLYAPSLVSTNVSATATWTNAGLAPGAYDVQVTWTPDPNRASNAPYQIFDGNTLLATVQVNQQQAPSGPTVGGVPYQSLGTYSITTGTLRVVLSNNANGFVIADADRVAAEALPAVVDDAGPNFSTAGVWTTVAGRGGAAGGVNNEYRYADPTAGAATATATWQVAVPSPGAYDVDVTWTADLNRASNATYQVFDGNTLLGTVTVNQQQAPSGPTVGGVSYQSLGIFQASSGTLRVVLGNNANGFVIADAVSVAPEALPVLVDNGTANYSETGTWSTAGGGGFDGSYRFAAGSPGGATATATWQFAVPPASGYNVEVSWVPFPNRATNATYQVFYNGTLVATQVVNQQQAPVGTTVNGVTYQSLATISLGALPNQEGGGTIRVVLSNAGVGASSFVVADAVRVDVFAAP